MPTPIAATEHLNKLKAFRQAAYEQLGPSRDALFELTDAILLTPAINSFAELWLCPAFLRRWPSLYETVQDGQPDRLARLGQYLRELPLAQRLILMGDHTAWPRLKAKTLRDRTVEHQPNSIPGARPITVGQGYSTLAWVRSDLEGRSPRLAPPQSQDTAGPDGRTPAELDSGRAADHRRPGL